MTKTPPLAERERPGLSETLPGPVHPNVCQSCGAEGLGLTGNHEALTRWRECDEWDKPTKRVVVLCLKCSKKLIEPHPRLYIPLDLFEPFPGVMEICGGCRWRDGLSCRCPLAKHNGGPGLKIEQPKPMVAHICCGRGRGGARGGGWTKLYSGPATDCEGLHAAE